MSSESGEKKSRTRRKLLKVAALGATAMAALSCGGKTDSEPIVHGSTTQDGGGGVGRSAEDASLDSDPCARTGCGTVGELDAGPPGTTVDDAGPIGKTFDDAGPVGSAPVEAGPVGTAPIDAGITVDDGGAEQDGSG